MVRLPAVNQQNRHCAFTYKSKIKLIIKYYRVILQLNSACCQPACNPEKVSVSWRVAPALIWKLPNAFWVPLISNF